MVENTITVLIARLLNILSNSSSKYISTFVIIMFIFVFNNIFTHFKYITFKLIPLPRTTFAQCCTLDSIFVFFQKLQS